MGNINNKQNWNRKRDANVSQMSRIQRGNVELSSGLNDSSTSVVTSPPSSLPFAPPIFLPIPLSYPHNTLLRSLSVSETLYLLKCVSARKVVWRARCWWLEGMASELAPGVYTRRNSLWGTAHSVVVAYTLRNSRWCMAISLARKGQARPQTPQQRCRVSQHLCLHPHSLLPPQRPPN